jgi:hypothetical protein
MFPDLQSNMLWQLWEEVESFFVICPQRAGLPPWLFFDPLCWHIGIFVVLVGAIEEFASGFETCYSGGTRPRRPREI